MNSDSPQPHSSLTSSEWHEPGEPCLTCMIVEDEAAISLALEYEFADAGYEVVGPYASCADALQALKHSTPAVALLNTVLKDGSCLELARELTRLGVPFVIYSGSDQRYERAQELAGVPWVIKPTKEADVVTVVNGLVRN